MSQENTEGFIDNIKTGVTQAQNNFCPTASEISDSYLALVKSQQNFCSNSPLSSSTRTNHQAASGGLKQSNQPNDPPETNANRSKYFKYPDYKNSNTSDGEEKSGNYHTDRDFFRGLDGVLLKIIPFYIFNH